MDTIDALSVDAERNHNLKKAKLENGFYNIVGGEKVSTSKRLSVIHPATGKQLAAVPYVHRALLKKAINDARNTFSGWGAVPFGRRKAILASLLNKIDDHADELSALLAMTRPGQFYQLKCPVTLEHQPFLLRPMSVYGTGSAEGVIEFLYNVTGVGTHAMAGLFVGNWMDIVGPLGNTFTFEPSFRRILLVARGVGLATMAPLVQRAAAAGVALTVVMSARAPKDLMKDEFLRSADARVHSVCARPGKAL
jgi:hypothetical protein